MDTQPKGIGDLRLLTCKRSSGSASLVDAQPKGIGDTSAMLFIHQGHLLRVPRGRSAERHGRTARIVPSWGSAFPDYKNTAPLERRVIKTPFPQHLTHPRDRRSARARFQIRGKLSKSPSQGSGCRNSGIVNRNKVSSRVECETRQGQTNATVSIRLHPADPLPHPARHGSTGLMRVVPSISTG